MTNSEYTVIIPFFNEEKTLETAVTNLINENFASEIILVNDGSVDKSNEIALRLENKYEYIKHVSTVVGYCIIKNENYYHHTLRSHFYNK